MRKSFLDTIKKSDLRRAAAAALRARGYELTPLKARGLLPDSRWAARKAGREDQLVAIKVSRERVFGLARQSDAKWRTLSAVELVVLVVPTLASDAFEALVFRATDLIAAFDRARLELETAGRSMSLEMPVFIPLDGRAPKNVGHSVANLKDVAERTMLIPTKELSSAAKLQSRDNFFERVRKEFADKIGVEPAKVIVEFRVIS